MTQKHIGTNPICFICHPVEQNNFDLIFSILSNGTRRESKSQFDLFTLAPLIFWGTDPSRLMSHAIDPPVSSCWAVTQRHQPKRNLDKVVVAFGRSLVICEWSIKFGFV